MIWQTNALHLPKLHLNVSAFKSFAVKHGKIPYAKAVVKLENLILHSDSVYLFDVNSCIEFFNIYNPKLWIASSLDFELHVLPYFIWTEKCAAGKF